MYCSKCGANNSDKNNNCSNCGKPLIESVKALGGFMYCSKCGANNSDKNNNCSNCGKLLIESVKAQGSDVGVSSIIPYKNVPALAGYYLGVFSIIPCFPLGIAALVLGLKGLKKVKENPELKGKAHALVGIIVGGFFGLIWTISTIIWLIMLLK